MALHVFRREGRERTSNDMISPVKRGQEPLHGLKVLPAFVLRGGENILCLLLRVEEKPVTRVDDQQREQRGERGLKSRRAAIM